MKPFILIAIIFLLPSFLDAQVESWNGLSLEQEVTTRWAYLVNTEHRRKFSKASTGKWLLTAGINRKLGKEIELSIATRYTVANDPSPAILRLLGDLYYSKKPNEQSPLTFKVRLRYHRDKFFDKQVDPAWQSSYRSRFGVDFSIMPRLSVFAAYEARYRFDRRNEWSRVRYTGGIKFKLEDKIKLEIFYQTEERINQANPSTDKVIGLYLTYILPNQWEQD